MLLSRVLGGVLVLAVGTSAAQAQGWIEIPNPTFMNGTGTTGPVAKVRSAVNVTVSGRVARVTVEEWFRNAGPVLNEASYLFPLPGEAVFSNYSLWQGEQELRGEMMDAGQARGIYEAIVRAKKDPALIELVGHGLIRARVFPLNPGETRKITLRYTQMLDRTGDAWRFRYTAARDQAPRSFRLHADSAERLGEPYSPTHRVNARRDGGRITVSLADTSWTGDLELLLPITRGLVGLTALTNRPVGEDGFFMLLLAPGRADAPAVRRDLVAVMDVSGSMSGDKIEQAKIALTQLLGTLRAGDRFRLVAFSNYVRRYAEGWTVASADARRQGIEWVQSLSADGGTNIAGALTEAFAAAPDAEALGMVVFLTDGLPSTGESNPERLAEMAEQQRGRFRVFTFGVGHDVNTFLLDRIALRARGASEYVSPGGSIEQAVGALAAKTSTPVLTDLAIAADAGVELYDLQPGELPDLFGGDELVVLGRYRGPANAGWSIHVRGRRAGREERFSTATGGRGQAGTEYVTQLWASRKAASLSRELRLHGQSREVMEQLRNLALRYGILTEYTSYLVQEPNLVAQSQFRLDAVTVNAAPAPSAQVGAGAVQRAREEAKASTVRSLADSEGERGYVARDRDARAAATRRLGNRMFVLRDSTWTDIGHADSSRLVTVAPYSDAYFALLRALPELVKAAALEPAVVVAGQRVSIKIGGGGQTSWSTGELEEIVRKFRG
jgi:Ca-activated chloride channel family protein